jgi:hypothetical protein
METITGISAFGTKRQIAQIKQFIDLCQRNREQGEKPIEVKEWSREDFVRQVAVLVHEWHDSHK